jgi:hypothetical protein
LTNVYDICFETEVVYFYLFFLPHFTLLYKFGYLNISNYLFDFITCNQIKTNNHQMCEKSFHKLWNLKTNILVVYIKGIKVIISDVCCLT